MMNYPRAYPTGIESVAIQAADLDYGGTYVVTVKSSTGNSADLNGIRCKEVVSQEVDDANDLNIQWPGISREFVLNGSGMFNDTILTPKPIIDQQVAQVSAQDLDEPVKFETTQKLYWQEPNSNIWREFDTQVIAFEVVRYNGTLKARTEYQGVLISQNYTGPQPN